MDEKGIKRSTAESGRLADVTSNQPSLTISPTPETKDLEPASKRIKVEESEISSHQTARTGQVESHSVVSSKPSHVAHSDVRATISTQAISHTATILTQQKSCEEETRNEFCFATCKNESCASSDFPVLKATNNRIGEGETKGPVSCSESGPSTSVAPSASDTSQSGCVDASKNQDLQASVPPANIVVCSRESAIGSSNVSATTPHAPTLLPAPTLHANTVVSSDSNTAPHLTVDGEGMMKYQPSVPLKSISFVHLHHKYLGELEYMLREFQKLERQLLGAKVQNAQESAGSKERREKLHSFIVHLEETIQQIISGCELENDGKSNSGGVPANGKVEDENVQKLEEHILANLLPVKVRLKRQLAAQQGAKHNPAGMPTVRGGMQPIATTQQQAKATFLRHGSSAERRPSQFGKSLDGEGSKLTQNLHGQTVDSTVPMNGTTRESIERVSLSKLEQPRSLPTGVTKDRNQMKSSIIPQSSTITSKMQTPAFIENPTVQSSTARIVIQNKIEAPTVTDKLVSHPQTSADQTLLNSKHVEEKQASAVRDPIKSEVSDCTPAIENDSGAKQQIKSQTQPCSTTSHPVESNFQKGVHLELNVHDSDKPVDDGCVLTAEARHEILCYEERRRLMKKRRKKKKRLSEHRKVLSTSQQGDAIVSKRSKRTQSQRGPRNVEYMCALCNEVYNSVCDYNPWWALTQHDCPKCCKLQIPRIDISAPMNAIEYHPALLAHAEENGGGSTGASTPSAVMFMPTKMEPSESESESDLSDDDGLLSDGDDYIDLSESDTEEQTTMSAGEQAENEKFGLEYEGPKLLENHTSRLLLLILHASACPGQHKNEISDEVCRSTKWMMLHVRDCPGTTVTGDVCPFPWCRKVKHVLYHLVSCQSPDTCLICSPRDFSRNMHGLNLLTNFRLRRRRALLEQIIRGSIKGKSKSAISNEANTVLAPISCIEIIAKNEIPTVTTVMDTGTTVHKSNTIRPDMPSGQKFYENGLKEPLCQRIDMLGNGLTGVNSMPAGVDQLEHNPLETPNILTVKKEPLQTSVTNLPVKSEFASVLVDASCNSSRFAAHSGSYEQIVPHSSIHQRNSSTDVLTSNLNGSAVLNSSIPSTEAFPVLGSTPRENEPFVTGESESITCVENSTNIIGECTFQYHPAESNDAMKSATVVTTSESDSEKQSTSNVFSMAAKTSKNTSFPSDDSLHSALAPFLTDACDPSEFQSDTMISHLVPSASTSVIAQEFDHVIEASNSVENNNPSLSHCSNGIAETCSKTTEISEANNKLVVDVASSQTCYPDCDQSLAIGDAEKEPVLQPYSTEPAGIRKDRVSSESLMLRVQ